MSKRRSFSIEQKMQILREASFTGGRISLIAAVLMDSSRTITNWILKPRSSVMSENEKLKRVIARQALELEVKTELLKKTEQLRRRGHLS